VARAAVAAVDAGACVRNALRDFAPEFATGRRWHVLAAGKAAGPMLRAALDSVKVTPAAAVCVAPHAIANLPSWVDICIGGHPVPTPGSVAAGHRALAMAAACGDEDHFLVLLSGGASALLAAPAGPLTLADKQATTHQLLRAGADIHAVNTVRKHLSRTKGGRLAASCRAATTCLAISDVVGDDPSVIGSGPTVADPTTFADALAVIEQHGGRAAYPPAVVGWLEDGARTGHGESPKPGDASLERVRTVVIASRLDAVRGASAEAARLGYTVTTRHEPVVGEARDAASAHGTWVREAVAGGGSQPVCVVSAGETTVTVTGSGLGGRNQEFALACLPWLGGLGRDVVVASVGTDGIDGPTDAAGAVADSSTTARALAAGLPAAETFLAANDAYHFFAGLGDLVITGPSGTNVGDVQIVMVNAGQP
jgi:hydroxypyruvate reductase